MPHQSSSSSRRTIRLAAAGAVGAVALVAVIAAFDRRGSGPPAPFEEPAARQAETAPAETVPAAPPPAPPARSPSVTAPPSRRRAAPDAASPLDESAIMAQLQALGETNPTLSLQLAREGNARFPLSSKAPERQWILVKSLVNLQRFDEARAEARLMVERYPNDDRTQDVQRHLLSNPP